MNVDEFLKGKIISADFEKSTIELKIDGYFSVGKNDNFYVVTEKELQDALFEARNEVRLL